tara:strand:+ start:8234 stop:8719 length:486 start_codon:yes stop_codon:yes gene_type:complete
MFTQNAYKNPSIMLVQLKEYISSVAKNNNWNNDYTENVLLIIQESYDNQYSFFKFNETIIKDFLLEFQMKFEEFTEMYTNGNVNFIPKYEKVMNVLRNLTETTQAIKEIESVSNIAQEQAIEAAEDLQQKSDDTFQKFIPYVGLGVVAYFVLPRVIREFQK